MLNWLYEHTNLEIGAFFLVGGLTITTLAPWLIRYRKKITIDEHLAKGAEESMKLFISLTLLLLAFCLVRMHGDHRGTEDVVMREATVMLKLERVSYAYEDENGDYIRAVLRDYADLVIEEEWPLLSRGERGEKTSQALRDLARRAKQLDPETPEQQVARSEVIQSANLLSDLREARISASLVSLPEFYWYAISASLVFLTVFGWLQSPLPKLITYVGGVTCGLSLLLTVLISTAGIFKGESAVTPEPIQKAIEQMAAAQSETS